MTQDARVRLVWDDASLIAMDQAMLDYGRAVLRAVEAVATYFEAVLEEYAKQGAPWTDRTGNARQTLRSWSETVAEDVVYLWLEHGMEYGIYLEKRWGGRYAVIWPTIEAHLDAVSRMLQGIFA